MQVKCYEHGCNSMIEDSVIHGTCETCVKREDALFASIEEDNAALQRTYTSLSTERKAELDAEYVRICEESGCACCWYSFLSQFM